MDYNADHYTIGELLTILGLDEYDITADAIVLKTSEYRHDAKQKRNEWLVSFFEQVQTKLLRYLQDQDQDQEDQDQEDQDQEDQDQEDQDQEEDQEDQDQEEDQEDQDQEDQDQEDQQEDQDQDQVVDVDNDLYVPNDEQTKQWTRYETLPQPDELQRSKLTDRTRQTELYDNGHMPMKREQLGVNQTHSVPVVQDSLNPTLKNVTNRFINLDSQFRQPSGGNESLSTDFTLDLSDPLTNVLSLRLYSIQIPYTWYAIDTIYGNTCCWLTNRQISYLITVDPGNYTPAEFCLAIQRAFLGAGFTFTQPDPEHPIPIPMICTYYANEAKIRLQLDHWADPDNQPIQTTVQYESVFQSETDAYFTFYDVTGFKTCQTGSTCNNNASHKFDNTLGWLMGFRVPIQPVFTGGNKPLSVINLYGTKYFIVVLDDYNQNHINNGLITITEQSGSFAMPSYYHTSQPYICRQPMNDSVNIDAIGNLSNVTNTEWIARGINPSNIYNTVQDKWTMMPTPFEQILPSAPRTLTNAQLYTMNELIKTRNKNTSFRSKAPTNSDTFAIIPIKYNGLATGQLYTEVSGQFQDNKRVYFGPVNIERMRLRLLDDRGNIIDLHGADWCVTILSENLYQY